MIEFEWVMEWTTPPKTRPLYINAHHVSAVEQMDSHPEHSVINLNSGDTYCVAGNPAEVQRKLKV